MMLAVEVSQQVMVSVASVAADWTRVSFQPSMLFFTMPLEVLPEAEGFLARYAVIALT